jgi:hypothetical protein
MPRDGKNRSPLGRLLGQLRRLLRKKGPSRKKEPPEPEADPYAYVTSPLRRGPKGRSGAAIAEIEEDSYRSFPARQR